MKRTWKPGPKFYAALVAWLGQLAAFLPDGLASGELATLAVGAAGVAAVYLVPSNSPAGSAGAPPAG